ncbi:MAG: DinB family protein [Cyclobacteriaceae bacterium]
MNTRLHQLFNSLEAQRHQLLERVSIATDRFNIRPGNNKWSIHQILAHLVASEKLSNQYLRKKIQGIDEAGDTGMAENLKMLVLKTSQRLPFKFNAPKPIVASTVTYQSLDELVIDWNTSRENLASLLEQIKDDQLKRKIFKHPAVGKLNIAQALEFIEEHVAHHLPQVNRLLK